MTEKIFSPIKLGRFKLNHRVVMAPLTRNRAPDAVPGLLMQDYYCQRAHPQRGASLVISEGTAISPQAQGYTDVPGLYTSVQLDGWRDITDAVHAEGGLIFCQLWHVGRVSHALLQPGQQAPVGPSAIRADTRTYLVDSLGHGSFKPCSMPRALHREEIAAIVHDYASAARNAVQSAGFDGVEIHGANGYLLEQFMFKQANQRQDDYGGSLDNRLRLMLEVVRAVIDAVGGDRVGLRLSPSATVNGLEKDRAQHVFNHLLQELASQELAYLHIIEGQTGFPRADSEDDFDYLDLKSHYRNAGGQAAWMLNNGYTPEMAKQAVSSGKADLISFGRGFISMPDYTERLRRHGPYVKARSKYFYGGDATGYTDYPALEL